MVEAVVSSVLRKLADFALNKALKLYKVGDQVERMQRELGLIKSLLQDAHSKRKTSSSIKQWLYEVRNVAYRIEDAIETFLIEIEEKNSKGSVLFSNVKMVWKHPNKLGRLDNKFKDMVQILEALYKRKDNLGIEVTDSGSVENTLEPFRPSKLSDIDDSEVVGFDTDKQKIVHHLLDKSISRRIIFSIVGIGGLGKTTLAKKIYKSAELDGKFDCRAWLSISQKFNLANLYREIMYSINPQIKSRDSLVRDEDLLKEEIKKCLHKKKYFIVLDDVWTDDLWNRLKLVLPDEDNGSRVLLTSRSLDVARAADSNTDPYELRYLDEPNCLALLFRKAFQKHIQPKEYPPGLIEVAMKLTRKCGRLPLAIVALGGILAKRERTFAAWQIVDQTMNWRVDNDGQKCLRVLALSYEDLPYQLIPCFLYFASFPEDYKISAKHITRMWVAEGFIPDDGKGTLEDRAEHFLNELISRCLVQVIEKSWNGNCKYCNIHDLLRDLAIHEAKEENFFTVFSKEEIDNQQGPSSVVVRRATLQFCTPMKYGNNHSENTRTLLCFGDTYITNHKEFRLLRVLVIERVNMSRTEIDWSNSLKGLIHLRYLGFRYCERTPKVLKKIPFRNLKNLETLDCKHTYIDINDSLWEIQTLRHVIIEKVWKNRDLLKCKVYGLKLLQTLKWVGTDDIPTVDCNVNLRTLKIRDEHGHIDRWQKLKAFLARAVNLVSLAIVVVGGNVPFLTVGTRDLPCHEKLESLYLKGSWARDACVPCVEMFPKNLTKLKLKASYLVEDPMPILEKLQNLRILQLRKGSYEGTKLTCSTGGFPSLQKLDLIELAISQWEIKEGAMPMLSHLKISCCDKLLILPDLQNVPSLQELVVNYPLVELNRRMQSDDRSKMAHIPSVRISNPRT